MPDSCWDSMHSTTNQHLDMATIGIVHHVQNEGSRLVLLSAQAEAEHINQLLLSIYTARFSN